jgi:LacI family transcriptional regulator
MPARTSTSCRRPHVALIIETSLAAGRGMLCGIAQYVREQGPWSIYFEPRGLEETVPVWLNRWRGDGIIARLSNRRIAAAVLKTGLPVVDTLGVVPYPNVPVVHPDDWAAGRLAADHLLERGFRHFGYCGVRVNWSHRPGEAFLKAIGAAGYECGVYELPLHTRSRKSWEMDQERLARWIGRLPKPAAIMTCSDPRAQRVLEACRRAGVVVPDEVAVIGVGNDEPMCELCDPPLSSVVAGHRQVGYEAARILDRLMQGGRPSREPRYMAPLGVVTRQSTDIIAVDDADTIMAVRFIREHAADGIGVNDVAAHCLLSRTELKRRFRRYLHRSIHDQIVRERLKQAQQLLASSDMPMAQIARKAGFGSQTRMGVVFKSRVGQTPSQYRKTFRG